MLRTTSCAEVLFRRLFPIPRTSSVFPGFSSSRFENGDLSSFFEFLCRVRDVDLNSFFCWQLWKGFPSPSMKRQSLFLPPLSNTPPLGPEKTRPCDICYQAGEVTPFSNLCLRGVHIPSTCSCSFPTNTGVGPALCGYEMNQGQLRHDPRVAVLDQSLRQRHDDFRFRAWFCRDQKRYPWDKGLTLHHCGLELPDAQPQ